MRRTANLSGRGQAVTFGRQVALIVTAAAVAVVVSGSQAGATANAHLGASSAQAQGSIAMPGPAPLVTLAQRRADVRRQTSAAGMQTAARQLRLQGTRKTAVKRRLPNGMVLGPNGTVTGGLTPRPAATSSDPFFPAETDAWLTGPAGGVVAAASEQPAAPYDQVPAPPEGISGNVYSGERLTITDEVSLECSCGYSTPPSRQVAVSFEVDCSDVAVPSVTVLVPQFGTQTVTAETPPDPVIGGAIALVQATFTMPSTNVCPLPPEQIGSTFPNVVVHTSMVIPSSGNTNADSISPDPTAWEFGGSSGIIPSSQAVGAPCAADSAGPGHATHWGGDPVNALNGECAETATDGTVMGPGYPLVIQRNYTAGLTGTSGPLGPGWTMPWFALLSIDPATGNVTFNAENGNRYAYTSNGDGTFTAPFGASSVLTLLSSGDYTLTLTHHDVLTFSSSGQLLAEKDPTNRGLSFSYSGGKLSSVTDAAGRQVTLAYAGAQLTGITLPDGHTIAYAYTSGLLTSATIPGGSAGSTTSYAYDSSSRLISITDADGHRTVQNTYNAQGQITSQTDAAGAVTKFSYTTTSSGLAETDITDPDGGIRTCLYGSNVLMAEIDPLGHTTHYTYNTFLEPVAVTDPLHGIAAMSYDGNGNLQTLSDPLQNEQQWTYDSSNNQLSHVDAAGNTTSYTYNGMDEVTSVTNQDGGTITYSYDGSGNLITSVDPRGNVSGANPASYTTSYAYNPSGMLASVTTPAGSKYSYAYDSMGSQTSATDPLGHATTYAYDAGERLTSVTAPDGGVTGYAYDAAGNLTSLTNPDGHPWTYGYDADNRPDKVTSPLGSSVSYGYDGNGNQVTSTDGRGIVTTTSYDADNRSVKITYSDGTPSVSYGYDADSNLTSVTDATGTRTMSYDAAGELTGVTGPGSRSFGYVYTPDKALASQTYPDGTHASYTYNGEEQLASLTVGAATATYSYDPAGDLTSSSMANGVTESRTYNTSGQLTSISDSRGSTALDSYGLTLNADGQPAQAAITQNGSAQPPRYYGYDSNGRLISGCVSASGSATCSAASAGTATGSAPAPAAPAGMVTSGITGKCMDDFHSGTANGNKVDSTVCNAGVAQQWTMAASGTVQVFGRCLQVTGGGTASGTTVELDACVPGSTAQQWKPGTSGTLVNPASGKCLTDPGGSTTNGIQLQITTCGSAASQTWRPPTALAPAGALTSGIAGKCLDDFHSGTANGNKVDSTVCNGGVAQDWIVQDNGTVQVLGKCLAVTGGGTASGTTVELDACASGSAAQQWAVGPNGWILNPAAGKCLSDPGNATADGTQQQIITCTGASGQTWTLPKTTTPATPSAVKATAGAASATLTWAPPSSDGGSALTGYTITAAPGGATASAGPYATGTTVSGLTPGTAYTFTVTASNHYGSSTTPATAAVTPGNETTYAYDKAGNLTSSQSDGLTTTSTYNAAGELTQAVTGGTSTTYAYDADGNQTAAGANTFSYNGAGNLSKAVTPAGSFSYGYDAGGNLTTASLNGSVIQGTTWDINGPLPQAVEDTGSSGATSADYLYGPGGTLASMTTPAGAYSPVTDALGSVTGLVSSAGTQVSTTTYSPYGTPSTTSLTSAPVSSIGYAGSYTVPGGSGLDDMRARDYSPATGAFTATDPALPLTGHPYAYAQGDPVFETDPSGLCSFWNLYCVFVQPHIDPGLSAALQAGVSLLGWSHPPAYYSACFGWSFIVAVQGCMTTTPDGHFFFGIGGGLAWPGPLASISAGYIFGAPNPSSCQLDQYASGWTLTGSAGFGLGASGVWGSEGSTSNGSYGDQLDLTWPGASLIQSYSWGPY